MRLDGKFVAEAIDDASILNSKFPENPSFSIDSRTLKKGEFFVALKGSAHDGHDFIAEAVKKGAIGVLMAESKKGMLSTVDKKLLKDVSVILVSDVLQALYKLAQSWRNKFSCPVIAITGSVGKTSTKEIVRKILNAHSQDYFVSCGNQNTKLGLALNMLLLRDNHKAAVFEVGISRRGEMAERADLLRPTGALITTIGHSHMEGLGSLADIAAEKREIFKNFDESNIGIVNGDVPLLANVAYAHPMIKFGSKMSNQIQVRKLRVGENQTSFVLNLYKKKNLIKVDHTHVGFVQDAVAASAIAYLLDVPQDIVITSLNGKVNIEGRFEHKFLPAKKGFVISDCYNANPESIKESLMAFEKLLTPARKIVILGDMLELGVNSPFWHRQLGRFLRKVTTLDHVVLIGDLVKWTRKTLPKNVSFQCFDSWEQAVDVLKDSLVDKSEGQHAILVKGSHAMKLEKIVSALTENAG